MEKIIPINWLNKILLIISLSSTAILLLLEQWFTLTSLPLYIPLLWSLVIITVSTWVSCIILKYTLKATSPLNIEPLTQWLKNRLKSAPKPLTNASTSPDDRKAHSIIGKLVSEIDERYISTWYDSITTDTTFRKESKSLLLQLFKNISKKLSRVNEIRLTHKLADVLLLHLKEYRRSLRRIEKASVQTLDEAYRCSHPGSRSTVALEHTLHRMVTLIAREFLQWELSSSLPCKLLLTVIAKRLLKAITEFSDPNYLFRQILRHLKPSKPPEKNNENNNGTNGVISKALTSGITLATAPVVPRPLETPPTFEITESVDSSLERQELSLQELPHQGLWAEDAEDPDDDSISPIYEEPTDFATTIARLRTLLQQKSTATTPQPEEKSYVVYEGNQFSNLAIPWTEFCTAPDGSQQLLYCIQFDDIEQHGEDLFETTTATTRRQYSDFVQLHAALDEIAGNSSILSEIKLPDGGRIEMENYLRTLCARLGDSSGQLRHFLRPSGSGKKADAVAPRFDRFLAKTVSGVFNTLKTVVPGFEMEEEEVPLPTLMPLADVPWRFVEDVRGKSLVDELKHLVAERIDYCTVDTAYEAVDTIEGSGDSELLAHWWETANCPYDEELEEIDAKLMMTCSVLDILCEVLGGIKSSSTIRQEAVVRWIKLFFGDCIEGVIQQWLREIFEGLRVGGGEDDVVGEEDVEGRVVEELVGMVYGELRLVFGEGEVRTMVEFFVKSFGSKRVNSDLGLQVLDVLASEALAACREGHKKG